jgi:hypothetical protein
MLHNVRQQLESGFPVVATLGVPLVATRAPCPEGQAENPNKRRKMEATPERHMFFTNGQRLNHETSLSEYAQVVRARQTTAKHEAALSFVVVDPKCAQELLQCTPGPRQANTKCKSRLANA